MNNGKTVGMILFIGGIILLIAYGLYLGFEDLMESLDVISEVFIGIILIGLAVLIISIVLEQRKDTKETMKDIKKEDLEP
ncbi:MAG: hypothetical protein BV456_05865 [Thermoplasmata archaeon M8B2D]|jgi:membrane-bound ClpP family serine protease|nr:MAG: hypothetical protein BV456_05865 [Thermoplasmata archaeon M8B2D]